MEEAQRNNKIWCSEEHHREQCYERQYRFIYKKLFFNGRIWAGHDGRNPILCAIPHRGDNDFIRHCRTLQLNGVNGSKDLSMCAVAGGNLEIIRLVGRVAKFSGSCFTEAIRHRRKEAFDFEWLLDFGGDISESEAAEQRRGGGGSADAFRNRGGSNKGLLSPGMSLCAPVDIGRYLEANDFGVIVAQLSSDANISFRSETSTSSMKAPRRRSIPGSPSPSRTSTTVGRRRSRWPLGPGTRTP